jgi:UDP-GlcNAc:undecaprenyl-phosphate GlcNAc-1-phosphate transferase
MTDGMTLAVAFGLAAAVAAAATPCLIAIAHRTGFYDHPTGYKQHAAATPYLGGIAVVLGLFAGSLTFGSGLDGLRVILAVALAMAVLGTLDDRVGLGIGGRVLAEIGAGGVLYAGDIAWSPFASDGANLLLTIVFVLGVINAYNLMDNLDGAAATVALVSAAGLGVYATAKGDVALGAVALAMAGACAGFLPYNLSAPAARIFLGDGGSMPIGATIAGLIMALPGTIGWDWHIIPVLVVLVGLPAFDTALVIVSRRRRGVNVLSGGRDHLTHRLLAILGSPRRVALALAWGQTILSAVAIAFLSLSKGPAAAAAGVLLCLGAATVVLLETQPGSATPKVASAKSES